MTPMPVAELLRPSQTQWNALPRMFSHEVLRGAVLLGFGGFMGMYFWLSISGEPESPAPSYEVSLSPEYFFPYAMFAVFFLVLAPALIGPRPGIWLALVAVQLQKIVSIGFGLEPVWWYWYATAVLGVAAMVDLAMGWRQYAALNRLRESLKGEAPATLAISQEQAGWAKQNAMRGRWWVVFLTTISAVACVLFIWLLGRGRKNPTDPNAEPFDSFLLAVAISAALGAVVLLCRILWRLWRFKRFGSTLWILPDPRTGPVSIIGIGWLDGGALSRQEREHKGCSCYGKDEITREDPANQEPAEAESYDEEIDRHCELHGVDVVNAISAAEFSRSARARTWVWDSESFMPVTALGLPVGVLGYGGTGFLGRTVLLNGIEILGEDQWRLEPGENYVGMSFQETLWKTESKRIRSMHPAPRAGRRDLLDLRPFGIDGYAQRYRHGYPIFVPAEIGGATKYVGNVPVNAAGIT